MNAAERLALIRARVKSRAGTVQPKPTGLYRKATGTSPITRKEFGPPPFGADRVYRHPYFIIVPGGDWNEWIKVPDQKTRVCRTAKRTKKISPLTKIAEAWEDPATFMPAS